MIYEAWRITYQSSEAAARAAYNTVEKLHEENQALRKYVDGLRAALGAQVRFGSEGFLAAIEKLPRYTYNYASEDGKFLLRDEVLAAIASQVQQATPTADMGNTTSQSPTSTEAGNPASGAQDKMSTTQQPEATRLVDKYEIEGFLQDHRFAQNEWCRQAVAELRRLHAENQDLQHRVQELGEMARENRSKKVIELEGRIAEMEEQMAAIGAGGVEPLRKRGATAYPTEGVPTHETCETCQGNGEIVKDWDRYKNPHVGDKGDEAVSPCPDCEGTGEIPPAHPAGGVPAQAVELEVDDLIDRLLDAQQDLNLAANVHMDQSIASASTLLDEVEIALRTLAATQPAARGLDVRDEAFEAVRKSFCKLQRYSFFLDSRGNVRRCADHCGNWVEFEAVHTLFEPQSVDAALAAQAKQGAEK